MVDWSKYSDDQLKQMIQIRPVTGNDAPAAKQEQGPGVPPGPQPGPVPDQDKEAPPGFVAPDQGQQAPPGFEPPGTGEKAGVGAPPGFLPPGHVNDHLEPGPIPDPEAIQHNPQAVQDRTSIGHAIAGQLPEEDHEDGSWVSSTMRAASSALDLHIPKYMNEQAGTGQEMLKQGIADILAGRSATGTGRAVMGMAQWAIAPVSGIAEAVGTKVGDFATNMTGNPDFGDKVNMLSQLVTNGGIPAAEREMLSAAPLLKSKDGTFSKIITGDDGKVSVQPLGKRPVQEDFDAAARAIAPNASPAKQARISTVLTKTYNARGTFPSEAVEAAQKSEPMRRDLSAGSAGPVTLPARPGKQYLQYLEDRFFQLRGKYTASRLEMNDKVDAMPAQMRDGDTQEQMYKHAEGDPTADMTPAEVKLYNDHVVPLKKEEHELFEWLKVEKKALGLDNVDLTEFDPTYQHRMVRGKTPQIDRLAGVQSSNPTRFQDAGGGLLNRNAPSLNERTYFTMQNERGERVLVKRLNGGKSAVSIDKKYPGLTFKPGPAGEGEAEVLIPNGPPAAAGEDGHTWTMVNSWTREIESNTATRYYKNAVANTIDNILRMRTAKEAILAVKELRGSDEWAAYTSRGGQSAQIGHNGGPPLNDGGTTKYITPEHPLFKNDYMDPRIAHIINDFYGVEETNRVADLAQKVNDFAITSLFWTPFPHAANAAAWWFTERGWDNFTPRGMQSLVVNGAKALHEVWSLGPTYQKYLQEGASLIRGGLDNPVFYKNLLQKTGTNIAEHPEGWSKLAQMTGIPTAAHAVQAYYRGVSQVLWFASDTFAVQRIMELEGRGMTTSAAIKEMERTMPNYRIPSNLMINTTQDIEDAGRLLSQSMRRSVFTEFGKYHWNTLKGYANMFADTVHPKATMEQRIDAFGKVMALGVLTGLVYPAISAVWNELSGEETQPPAAGPGHLAKTVIAPIVQANPDAFPDFIKRYYKDTGQSLPQALSSMMFSSPSVQAWSALHDNVLPSGRPAIMPADWRNSHYDLVAIEALIAASQIGFEPANALNQAMTKGTTLNEALMENIFGFTDHTEEDEAAKQRAFRWQDKEARKRGFRPPTQLEWWLRQQDEKLKE